MACNHARTNRDPIYKWVGFGEARDVETSVGTAVTGVMQFVPCLVNPEAVGEVTVEAVYMHISLRCLLVSTVDAVGYILAIQKCDIANGNPVEVLNPLAVTSAD